jgi:precorrin-2 dehydrogenase / sirohydrochlorin ferrochelatase
MSLFPVFVKLEGRAALVVGGGALAEAKVWALLEAGAEVRVVAPKVSAQIRAWAEAERIKWIEREFFATDAADMVLVFAATGRRKTDRTVADLARRFRVPVNAVDDPEFCDFYMPAIVRRGDLQIAVSTNGHSPALAQQIRERLEQEFSDDWTSRVSELGERRRRIIESTEAGPERTAQLQQIAREVMKELLR